MQQRQLIQNLISALRVQTSRRLIQNQKGRIHRQDSRDRHPAFLSSGQLKRRFFIIAFIQPYMLQSLFRALLTFFRRKSLILWSETDVGKNVCLKQLMFRILKHQSHMTAQFPEVVAFLPDILPVVINVSRGRPDQPVEMLYQRGLSAAGMTDHSDKLTVLDFHRHMFQGMHLISGSRAVGISHIF